MGTVFTVYLSSESTEQSEGCFNSVFEEIERIENTFSRFRQASEISRINALAAAQPVVTDPEVFQMLAFALEVSRKTSGAFDITVGPLTRAWGFAKKQARVPSGQQLESALQASGWANVVLDPTVRTVSFLRRGMELDLGGIAKGYAVDRVLELLRDAGVPAIIDAGSSSIAASGTSVESKGWKVLVGDPVDPTHAIAEVELRDRALSTSGLREQCFAKDGRKYCHLIDPRSGDAAVRLLQVTVLAPNSTLADALSTAMFILGPQQGIPILQGISGCSALWVWNSGKGAECISHDWPHQIG
jgi:thiamine biosynthesis lipoprotein